MAGDVHRSEKFQTLVADFVETASALGSRVEPERVAAGLQRRIEAIAATLGVSEAAALTHVSERWGREEAGTLYRNAEACGHAIRRRGTREVDRSNQ